MTSRPVVLGYSGVERLLGYWGGEVASFFTDDPAMLAPIAAIGTARVIEVAVLLLYIHQAFSAGTASFLPGRAHRAASRMCPRLTYARASHSGLLRFQRFTQRATRPS